MEDRPEYDGHTSYAAGYMAREKVEQRAVKVPLDYVDMMNGNVYAAMLLAQIVYWHGKDDKGKTRLKVKRDGHMWLAKEYGDWWDECRIKESTAKKHINQMVEDGILIKANFRFYGLKTTHIRINWDVFKKKLAKVQGIETVAVSYVVSDRSDTTCPTQELQRSRPLTEITSENTTTTAGDAVAVVTDDPPTPGFGDNTAFITGEKPNGNGAKPVDWETVKARPILQVLKQTRINKKSALDAASWIPESVAYGAAFCHIHEQAQSSATNNHTRGNFVLDICDRDCHIPRKYMALAQLKPPTRRTLVLAARALQASPGSLPDTVASWLPNDFKALLCFLEVCTRGPDNDPAKHYAWRDDSALWPAVVAWAGETAFTDDLEAWIDEKLEVTA
jgi:hypothetical protein